VSRESRVVGRIVAQAHERIGRIARSATSGAWMFRRLVIGNRGRARPMHGEVPDNPARGKAQGRTRLSAKRAPRRRTADGSSKPRSRSHPSPADRFSQIVLPNRRSVTPTKINRGGRGRHERHVGPDRQKCRARREATTGARERASCGSKRGESTRAAGPNLRRARRTPGAPSDDDESEKGRPASSGQAVQWLDRVAERHAKKARLWRMTRAGGGVLAKALEWHGSRASVTTLR
jgi:hypothetical protein